MKNFKILLTMFLLFLCCFSFSNVANAEVLTTRMWDGDVTYDTDTKTITFGNGCEITSGLWRELNDLDGWRDAEHIILEEGITEFSGIGDNFLEVITVQLPSTITSIPEETFANCSKLTTINIPENVSYIGSGAFKSCSSLTSIKLPASMTYIPDDILSGCSSLETVTLPDNFTEIGSGAFSGCSSLDMSGISAKLPNVTRIGDYAFSGCTKLTNVTLNSNIEYLGKGVFKSTSIESIDLPSCLEVVTAELFANTKITNIVIPSGIESIDDKAFYGSDIQTIVIPESVDYLGTEVFSRSKLQSIAIPSQVRSIPSNCFAHCADLTQVDLSNVTSLGKAAFYECSNLSSISLPSTLTTMGDEVFMYCTSLNNVVIPDSITNIPFCAFMCCSGLERIQLGKNVTTLGSQCFNSSGLIEVSIPDKVKIIPKNAFSVSYDLQKVVLPEGLETIDTYAFYQCKSLVDCVIPETVTSISGFAFSGGPQHIVVLNEDLITDYMYGSKQIHKYSDTPTIDVAGSCTVDEVTSKHCLYDRCTASTDVVTTPASGHAESDWLYADSNNISNGKRYKECINCNTELIAQYKLVVNCDDNTTIEADSYVNVGDIIRAVPAAGYIFSKWTGDIKSNVAEFTMPEKAINVSAQSVPDTNVPYTVKHFVMQADGSYSDVANKETTYYGSVEDTFKSSDYVDHSLEVVNGISYSYSKCNDKNVQRFSLKSDGSTVVNLYYERLDYTITFNAGTGVESIVDILTFKYGASVTLPDAVYLEGYEFDKWTGDKTSTFSNYKFKMPAYDLDLTVNGKYVEYEISYDLNGGEFNSDYIKTFTIKSNKFTLVNPTRNNYVFLGWTGSNGETPETQVIIPKGTVGDLSYKANWKANSITIEGVSDMPYTGESVSFNSIVVKANGVVVPSDNYTVDYTNNTEVGKASITVNLKDGYYGTATCYFNIYIPDGMTVSENGLLYEVITDNDFKALTVVKPTWSVSDNTITEVVIPDYLDVAGDSLPVVKVEPSAFEGYIFITKVELGELIKEVCTNAFKDCLNLKEVISLNINVVIDPSVFAGCNNIITYPGYVTNNNTENNTNNNQSSSTNNNNNQSSSTNNNSNVNVEQSKPDTVVKNLIGTVFIVKNVKYVITSPNTVSVVGSDKPSITKLTIPATVKYEDVSYKVTAIKDSAFKGYKKLKTISIGSNVTTVGKNAFSNCAKLNKVTLGKNITTVSSKAFYKCKKLKTIVIKSKKLKTLGNKSFSSINSKAKFDVPNSKVKTYKKLFKSKVGFKKTMKIK